jgi:hypothetical protein
MKSWTVFVLVVFCFGLTSGEVIFGDHFDSQVDWNSTQDSNLLDVWDQQQCGAGNNYGDYLGGYIDSQGAHDEGKGFRQYWDKDYGEDYAQDCWLINNDVDFPDEWYLGYWYRHQGDWDWGHIDTNLKLLKIHFDNPETTWDLGYWTRFYASGTTGYPRGYSLPEGCDIKAPATDEWGGSWVDYCWDNNDEEWHYWIWHVEHSTNTLEVFVDGVSVKDNVTPEYPGDGFAYEYGMSFGGNIGGGFDDSGVGEYWTDYDDVVVATSRIEVEEFLGLDGVGCLDGGVRDCLGGAQNCSGGVWGECVLDEVNETCDDDFDCDSFNSSVDCDDNDSSLNLTLSCEFNGTACGDFSMCVLSCPEDLEGICGESGVIGNNPCIHEADLVPCNGNVSLEELKVYLDRWLFGGVSVGDIVGAIGVWKS